MFYPPSCWSTMLISPHHSIHLPKSSKMTSPSARLVVPLGHCLSLLSRLYLLRSPAIDPLLQSLALMGERLLCEPEPGSQLSVCMDSFGEACQILEDGLPETSRTWRNTKILGFQAVGCNDSYDVLLGLYIETATGGYVGTIWLFEPILTFSKTFCG